MKEAITSAYGEGRLLSWLANAASKAASSEREAIFTQVTQLHDAGVIDALGALLDPITEWNWTPEWLARQQVLTALIPRLAASVSRMTAAIGAVRAGIVQHVLDDAFLAWCAADLSRAGELIAMLDEGTFVPDHFVLAALIAGLQTSPKDYLDISASMARGERPGGRHVGGRALGLMALADDASVAHAVKALRSIIEDRDLDPLVRTDALSAAVDIAVRVPAPPSEQFLDWLRQAPCDDDPGLLETCATAFGRHAPKLPAPLLECLREILPKLGPARMQAFDSVDMGLYQLLSKPGNEEQATKFIEALVRREDGDTVFERLDSTRHELSNGNAPRLSRVVIGWLLSGEPALCKAAATLIRGVHGRELSLTADCSQLPLTDAQASFLARKAIGWFLVHPLAPTSLIVSLLRQVTDPGAEPFGELLFDPLLMNYPGSVRRYLESVVPALSGAALKTIERTLTKHDAYLRAIEAIGEVPELHQSERNRRIEFQRQNDEFAAARRDAEKQSALLSIVRKTPLLHGVRTISYVDNHGGGTRRLDNKLGRISTEMERAMQWTFDPLGLEHTLLAFRLEQPPE